MTSLYKENNVRKQRAQNNVISFMPGNNYRPESQISVGGCVSTQTETPDSSRVLVATSMLIHSFNCDI